MNFPYPPFIQPPYGAAPLPALALPLSNGPIPSGPALAGAGMPPACMAAPSAWPANTPRRISHLPAHSGRWCQTGLPTPPASTSPTEAHISSSGTRGRKAKRRVTDVSRVEAAVEHSTHSIVDTPRGAIAPSYVPAVASNSTPATGPYAQQLQEWSSGLNAGPFGSHHVHPRLPARTGGHLLSAGGHPIGQFGPYAGLRESFLPNHSHHPQPSAPQPESATTNADYILSALVTHPSYAQHQQQEMPMHYGLPMGIQASSSGPARKRKAEAEDRYGPDVVSAGPIAGSSRQPAGVSRKATRVKRPAKARRPRVATKATLRWAVNKRGYLIYPETPEEAALYTPTHEQEILKDLKPLDCCKGIAPVDIPVHKGRDTHRFLWGLDRKLYVPILRKFSCGAKANGCRSVFSRIDEVPRHHKKCQKYRRQIEAGAGATTATEAYASSTATVTTEDMDPLGSAIPAASTLPDVPSDVVGQQPYEGPSFWTEPPAQHELSELPTDSPPPSTPPLATFHPLLGPGSPLTIVPGLLPNAHQQPLAVFENEFEDDAQLEQLPATIATSVAPTTSFLIEPAYTADLFTDEEWASAFARPLGNLQPTDAFAFDIPNDAPPSYSPWSSLTGASGWS
ncbi:hypothetical protein EWM64_g8888 [Hericium alpestre]|uniref:Uncharacterized protein n=1 Tax=Hericium alpestre TaxID=135208 RepID=A0A4Y9ZLG0_9AGAM|nr:hypothetical protein EWM64_g8888 [Hericium alpestre]